MEMKGTGMKKKKYVKPEMELVPCYPENLFADSVEVIKYVPRSDLEEEETYDGDDAL
jgi:hypothetical protein